MPRYSSLIPLLLATTFLHAAEPRPADPLAQRRTVVVEVFDKCKHAVVNISSTQIVEMRAPGITSNLFEQLFDLPTLSRPRQFKRTSVGSGFVIHERGYLVTNAHVVARTAERKVIFADGREFDAQIVALDEKHDLAVLKFEPDPSLPPAPLPLGTSADLMVGETVIAIGNPLGYQNTVTAGVVSALNRTLEVSDEVSFEGLIQTDASINPGNSGGPLLNVLGELVGVNTAIRADAQNIGFAIPVDQLRSLLPEMLDAERRSRIVTGFRLSADGRHKVVSLDTDGPAQRGGLRIGDTVTAVNGQPLRSDIDYGIALIDARPGDEVTLQVRRGDRDATVKVRLGERPRPDGGKLLREKFGITARPLTPRDAQALGLRIAGGLLVTAVAPASPAERIRLQPHDMIVQLGRFPAHSLDEVGELLEPVQAGDTVAITVLRVAGRVLYRTTVPIQAR